MSILENIKNIFDTRRRGQLDDQQGVIYAFRIDRLLIIMIFSAVMLLVGCSVTAQAPQPEPATTTPILPSPTLPVLISSQNDLIGVWAPTGTRGAGVYYKFKPDGTYNGARSRKQVEDEPEFHGEYWFEGNRLHLKQIEGWCAMVAVYEVHLLENGNIQPVMIEDDCGPRRRNLSFEMNRRPPLN